jgi:V/A-type H+-transporting ATPase subunit E
VQDAEQRAKWIVEQAKEQADEARAKAEQDAEFTRNAGAESLALAFRDIRAEIRDELTQQFARQLQKLIVLELQDPDTLKKLLMSAAARSALQDEEMTIVLPEQAVGLEELRQDPDALQQGPLIELISATARELFSSGITVETGGRGQAGMQVILRDGEVTVDLGEQALSDLLLAHLQPRFRAILEGLVY